MGGYIESILSEEQMAAYFDGMLSTHESNMVEDLIASVPELQELQDDIDMVDDSYLYTIDEDVPIECMADDFELPEISMTPHFSERSQVEDFRATEEMIDEYDNEDQLDDKDDSYEEFQNEDSEAHQQDDFQNNDYDTTFL